MINTTIAKLPKAMLVFSLLYMLSGCATYFERQTKAKCFNNDWFASGFDAAKQGERLEAAWKLADQRCAKVNVWASHKDFKQGYAVGLDAFCVPENGFEFGLRGKPYAPICDPLTQAEFDAAYHDGLELHRRENYLQQTVAKLDAEQEYIEYTTYRRRELSRQLDSDQLDEHAEQRIINERYRLKRRRRDAERNLRALRADLHQARMNLTRFKNELFELHYPEGKPDTPVYSPKQSVSSDNFVVTEPAIFIYLPDRVKGQNQRKIKQSVTAIQDYVISEYSRQFRFQVIGDSELLLIDQHGAEISLHTPSEFDNTATLLFWSPNAKLVTKPITPEVIELTSSIDEFISGQGNYRHINAQ